MGSIFKTDLTLFCIKNNYEFAINNRKTQIFYNMEKNSWKKYFEGFSIKNENDTYKLIRCSGPHSKFQNYFFRQLSWFNLSILNLKEDFDFTTH